MRAREVIEMQETEENDYTPVEAVNDMPEPVESDAQTQAKLDAMNAINQAEQFITVAITHGGITIIGNANTNLAEMYGTLLLAADNVKERTFGR